MSNAFWAYGSKFQLGDGEASETFTDVAEVIDITPPNMSKDSIDVSNQDSTDGFREKIPGWKDGGEVTFTMNWLPTNATQDETTGLWSHYIDDENHNYKIILPDTLVTISFTGHITSFNPDLPNEEQGQLEVTIAISGKPTVT